MGREQRKLAAIVAADVVGYSRLMGRDESGKLARLLRLDEPGHLNRSQGRRGSGSTEAFPDRSAWQSAD